MDKNEKALIKVMMKQSYIHLAKLGHVSGNHIDRKGIPIHAFGSAHCIVRSSEPVCSIDQAVELAPKKVKQDFSDDLKGLPIHEIYTERQDVVMYERKIRVSQLLDGFDEDDPDKWCTPFSPGYRWSREMAKFIQDVCKIFKAENITVEVRAMFAEVKEDGFLHISNYNVHFRITRYEFLVCGIWDQSQNEQTIWSHAPAESVQILHELGVKSMEDTVIARAQRWMEEAKVKYEKNKEEWYEKQAAERYEEEFGSKADEQDDFIRNHFIVAGVPAH